ncbi:uncharacterized protein CIMG_13330 [Coccidioides immitis RS]|uniref:Uncharacterized protein n=1 Tax=Coccidioides immitis (strain RS) TaxID=246410 RepID=A0A0D8JUA9_COCIM|nr:uncharacterized protein CIMG_13330 [Coccidioides immitis RS]KJF60935.1 hypothetical protein CIMG_13330 [Coccidioides immitis RS]
MRRQKKLGKRSGKKVRTEQRYPACAGKRGERVNQVHKKTIRASGLVEASPGLRANSVKSATPTKGPLGKRGSDERGRPWTEALVLHSSGRLELHPLSSESQRQTAIPNKHQASVIGHRTLASARLLKNQPAAGMGGRERNAAVGSRSQRFGSRR